MSDGRQALGRDCLGEMDECAQVIDVEGVVRVENRNCFIVDLSVVTKKRQTDR